MKVSPTEHIVFRETFMKNLVSIAALAFASLSTPTVVMAQDSDLAAVVTNAAQDIGSFIRTQREAAQVSVRQLAERAGVSNPYLSQIERGLRKPSAEVLSQIAKALRLSAEVLYVRAGILEPGQPSQVQDAIIGDTTITERQKRALLDIYTSFCQQNQVAEEPPTD
jgi:transcriptional regulator with XRE-family HTH domain